MDKTTGVMKPVDLESFVSRLAHCWGESEDWVRQRIEHYQRINMGIGEAWTGDWISSSSSVGYGWGSKTETQKQERTDSMIYQVAVVWEPSELDKQQGKSNEMVLPPTSIEANSETHAVMLVAIDHAEQLKGANPKRCRIEVKKF